VMIFLLTCFGVYMRDVVGTLLTGQRDSVGCKLCDKLASLILKQPDLNVSEGSGDVPCESMCFSAPRCVVMCKITRACIAAGLCPAEDEFGEVNCKWSYKRLGCEPANACEYRFPKCEVRPEVIKLKLATVRQTKSRHAESNRAFHQHQQCGMSGVYYTRKAGVIALLSRWNDGVLAIFGGSQLCFLVIVWLIGRGAGKIYCVTRMALRSGSLPAALTILRSPPPQKLKRVSAENRASIRSAVRTPTLREYWPSTAETFLQADITAAVPQPQMLPLPPSSWGGGSGEDEHTGSSPHSVMVDLRVDAMASKACPSQADAMADEWADHASKLLGREECRGSKEEQ